MADDPRFVYAMAYVDSHTEGEPTRVVHAGLPELARVELSRLRAFVVDEPRGHAALVAALLTPSDDPRVDFRVRFLNNVGSLPMCVHASIGIARTLVHLGLRPATPWEDPVRLEAPAGRVSV